MSFSKLSAELLYPILHSLRADNDYLSMKACSLTCRSLVSPSQTHIFHTIPIFFPSVTAAQVLRALQRYPHIQKYIKRIELIERNKVWMGTDTALGDVLKILCSSTVSLGIIRRLYPHSTGLHDLPALQNMTGLEELTIDQEFKRTPRSADQYTIAHFCNSFPCLRTLDLTATYSGSTATGDTAPQPPTFQLETLKLGWHCDDHILDWILPAIVPLKALHVLHISSYNSRSAISNIILNATSLKELHLHGMNVQDMTELSYVVTPLQQKTKNLCSLVLNTNQPMDTAIRHITAFLQLIGVHLFIDHIFIAFEASELAFLGRPFGAFEDIVLGPQFPVFKWLELRVTTDKVGHREEELTKRFPRISEHRRLLMTFRPRIRPMF